MYNYFLTAFIENLGPFLKRVSESLPNVTIGCNFEEVYALVKRRELDRLCIFYDAYNFSGSKDNYARGQAVAEKIHLYDPSIKVLIYNGRTYDLIEKDVPTVFQVSGNVTPIKYDNEVYIEDTNIENREHLLEILGLFFSGDLSVLDVPYREALNKNQVFF